MKLFMYFKIICFKLVKKCLIIAIERKMSWIATFVLHLLYRIIIQIYMYTSSLIHARQIILKVYKVLQYTFI